MSENYSALTFDSYFGWFRIQVGNHLDSDFEGLAPLSSSSLGADKKPDVI